MKPIALTVALALGAGPLAAQSTMSGQVPPPATAADVPGPVAGAPVSPSYAAAIGRMAYVWGWPLVNMRNRQEIFSMAPEPGRLGGVLPVAPVNRIGMLSDYLEPEQRFVTSPNQDVVYGAGFMALDETPVIVQVPDFGDRFWVYQIVDQRTDSFAEMGAQYGTRPGLYMLVGPNWRGQAPAGVAGVFRSSTGVAAVFPRIFMDDTAEDRAAIQPLIDQVMVYPLAEYDGAMRTIDWRATPDIPNPNEGGDGETAWVVPEQFFSQLGDVLDQVPPLPGEEALYDQLYFVLDAASRDPAVMEALNAVAVETEADVIAGLFEFRNNGVDAGAGWRTQKNSAEFGNDWFQRTATAKGNMFSNMPRETVYFGADFDAAGERLDGSKSYEVTFSAGQTPPVDGFWSLTLYNENHFFAPNELDRFSLGTKNKDLTLDEDGGLTIYVQAENPGPERESNWLPAPEAAFSLYIRAYWPKPEATNGAWVPPAIRAVN